MEMDGLPTMKMIDGINVANVDTPTLPDTRVAQRYIRPVSDRPHLSEVSDFENVGCEDERLIDKQIGDEGAQYDFFRVINHGVGREVKENMLEEAVKLLQLLSRARASELSLQMEERVKLFQWPRIAQASPLSIGRRMAFQPSPYSPKGPSTASFNSNWNGIGNQFGRSNWNGIGNQFGRSNWNGIRNQFGRSNWNGIGNQFGRSNWNGIGNQFGSSNWNGIGNPFGSSNWNGIGNQFDSSNWNGIGNPFGSSNWNGIGNRFRVRVQDPTFSGVGAELMTDSGRVFTTTPCILSADHQRDSSTSRNESRRNGDVHIDINNSDAGVHTIMDGTPLSNSESDQLINKIMLAITGQTGISVMGFANNQSSPLPPAFYFVTAANTIGFISTIISMLQRNRKPRAAGILAKVGAIAGSSAVILAMGISLPIGFIWAYVLLCIFIAAAVVYGRM